LFLAYLPATVKRSGGDCARNSARDEFSRGFLQGRLADNRLPA
jgi:hypothetical protein